MILNLEEKNQKVPQRNILVSLYIFLWDIVSKNRELILCTGFIFLFLIYYFKTIIDR